MPENIRNGPLPAHTIYEHPLYGTVVRDNFELNHPDEEMTRHRGRFVAWSFDGSKVLASAATIGEIHDEVNRLALGAGDYVIDRIPDDV